MSLEEEIKMLRISINNLTEKFDKIILPNIVHSVNQDIKSDNIIKHEPIKTRLIPVPNWENNHEWPRLGGLRNLIFNRHKNGLDQFGVVKKVGKRVLIDETAFFEWAKNQ